MKIPATLLQNKIHFKNYLLLLVIALLAYWPLTFGIFSVKNDAIHYFLPYRFQISETIRNGEWPFWNPYIYLGYPVQGDMQSGAWNPIVWIFSFINRYDLTLFHYENLLYIFLGGVGMYKLTNRLVHHSPTSLLIAISYMLSGFMSAGQLINWLAAAAFLPFVIHYYLQLLNSPSFSNAIKTGIALYLLFTAGYPSFVIITGYILMTLFMITIIHRIRNKTTNTVTWKRFMLQHLLILLLFTGLSLPAIVSYIDLLPYYQRGAGTSYQESLVNSFEWRHLLSFLFPTTIKANDVITSTDLTCRNVYIGLFTFIILVVFPPKINRRNLLLTGLALFALLFSLGDATPVRNICYKLIPFMNTFRHPSQMRLFFIFSILLLVAPGLKKFLNNQSSRIEIKRLSQLTWIFTAGILIITILAFIQSGILRKFSGIQFSQMRTALKNMLDSISFNDGLVISGLVQLLFLLAFLLFLKKSVANKKIFFYLWITNLFLMTQFVLPVTFVSKTSPKEINAIIHSSPKGFPSTGLENTIGENSKDALGNFDKIALIYFYNKKIGISHITNSPSFLTEQGEFIENNFFYAFVSSKPVTYIADSLIQLKDTSIRVYSNSCKYAFVNTGYSIKNKCEPEDTVIIKKISANSFEIETQKVTPGFLVLTQSYHPHWKVFIDGKKSIIQKTNLSFMGTEIPAGKHIIVFKFIPADTIKAIWIMMATLLLLLIMVIITLINQKKLNN
jgi:Bacterial membrane protein YfhO